MSFNIKDLENKSTLKRTQSEANGIQNHQFDNDQNHVIAAKILSYKMKKDKKDSPHAVYCVHVNLLSGAKWIVEKRYSQFRDFRKELLRLNPELGAVDFPRKKWFFNLTEASLLSRQDTLNEFLNEVVLIEPQPLEICKLHNH